MKLLMLGGSKAQLPGIVKAQKMGHTVITCDYLPESIGHNVSNESTLVSTFDLDGVLKVAKDREVDGIMTMGTDQPVYTAGYVSNRLGLPQVLSQEVSIAVTNKKVMKQTFVNHNINTVNYCLYKPGEEEKLEKLTPPLVIKPLDSQGQRGIYFLESIDQVEQFFEQVIQYSRCDEILVEEYYEHDEITVSGWVTNGQTAVLSITDRVTFDEKEHLGICLSHEFPSKHMKAYGEELVNISKKIVKAFNILNGPIYFQFLIGNEGIKVNEIACRIGGAFEATFIPEITNFDICEAAISGALGLEVNCDALEDYDVFENLNHISVQLFFMTPCKVTFVPTVDEIMNLAGVLEADIFVNIGDDVKTIENATSRAGYLVVKAINAEELDKRLRKIYDILRIEDDNKVNHIIHRKGIY